MGALVTLVVLSSAFGIVYAPADIPNSSTESIPVTSSTFKDIEITEGVDWVKVYGPPRRSPKCDLVTSIRNPEDANLACKLECLDISAAVNTAAKRYGRHFMIRRLNGECNGLTDGKCIQVYDTWFTHCKCTGNGWFGRTARYCRALIHVARISSNIGVWYTDDYQKWNREYRAQRAAQRSGRINS